MSVSVLDASEKAFARFMQALQSIVDDPAQQSEIAETYGRYAQALQEAMKSDPARRAESAFAEYEATIRGTLAADGSRKYVLDAFARYVKDVIDAMSAMDARGDGPARLALVAQQLGTVAWLADHTDTAGAAAAGLRNPGPTSTAAISEEASLSLSPGARLGHRG